MLQLLLPCAGVSILLCGCGNEDAANLEQITLKVDQQIADRHSRQLELKSEDEASAVTVLVEYIEVPALLLNNYTAAHPLQEDADGLRRETQVWLNSGQANLIDMTVVHGQSGQRSKVEAVHEVIYPTKYASPKTRAKPATKAKPDKAADDTKPQTEIAITPTAFVTRRAGSVLEIDPVIGKDGTIQLNLAPELSTRLKRNSWQATSDDKTATFETPEFHTAGVTTQVMIENGGYAFLGTGRLPEERRSLVFEDSLLLMFVRADAF